MSILLRTERWSQHVSADDPTFATFLEPYKELGETMPEKIEITGGAAEIIEKEWSNYEDVFESMSEWDSGSPTKGRIDEEHDDTPGFLADIARGKGVRDGWVRIRMLKSVSRLSRILNFPEGWEKYVGVDERSPQEERLTHLLSQGRLMMAARPGMSIARYLKTKETSNLINFPLRFLSIMAGALLERTNHSFKSGEDRSAIKNKINEIFFGLARNTVLRAYDRDHVVWDYVLWQDIHPLCAREGLPLTRLCKAMATADLLGGMCMQPSCDSVDYDICYNTPALVTIVGIDRLYHRILACLPRDSLYVMPLGVIIRGPSSVAILPSQVVYAVHSHIIGLVKDTSRVSFSEDELERIVKAMALSFVGRTGLVRILLSLLHVLSKQKMDHEHVDLLDRFARKIEEYLEGSPIDGEGTYPIGPELRARALVWH